MTNAHMALVLFLYLNWVLQNYEMHQLDHLIRAHCKFHWPSATNKIVFPKISYINSCTPKLNNVQMTKWPILQML